MPEEKQPQPRNWLEYFNNQPSGLKCLTCGTDMGLTQGQAERDLDIECPACGKKHSLRNLPGI